MGVFHSLSLSLNVIWTISGIVSALPPQPRQSIAPTSAINTIPDSIINLQTTNISSLTGASTNISSTLPGVPLGGQPSTNKNNNNDANFLYSCYGEYDWPWVDEASCDPTFIGLILAERFKQRYFFQQEVVTPAPCQLVVTPIPGAFFLKTTNQDLVNSALAILRSCKTNWGKGGRYNPSHGPQDQWSLSVTGGVPTKDIPMILAGQDEAAATATATVFLGAGRLGLKNESLTRPGTN